jgi:gluconate 2-dehydrogenase gamma chain
MMDSLSGTVTRREALRRVALLLGGAVSAPTLAGVLAGCERRAGSAGSGSALSAEQKEMIATIAEHILPTTDTPGAREVGVPDFIDVMLAEYYPEEERRLFLEGMGEVDERAREAHGSAFRECTPAQQVALLTQLDREAFAPPGPRSDGTRRDVREETHRGKGETPLPPEVESGSVRWVAGEKRQEKKAERPFFRTMKELTLVGYYTSEAGATQELRHAPVPGRYEACVPLAQVGKTWAV